ncbi:MAG: hypothetical protein KKF44_01125 [Nanoarchaeota archaeon]|nr:hypothetical protein [Nanoarchaeota archaeon]
MELEQNDEEKDNFWAEGSFIEGVNPDETQEKIKTMHKKHDEDMNYNCKKCNKKISAHNRDWHDCKCDECFNSEYFPEKDDAVENIEMDEELQEELKNFNPEEYSVLELCKENGTGINAINDANTEAFMPLLSIIEETIWRNYSKNNVLKDINIIESLKTLRNNIFSNNAKFNEMEKDILNQVKISLFFNNYDKRDLSLSISKVLKSVKLHRSTGGSRGYLNFISGFFEEME